MKLNIGIQGIGFISPWGDEITQFAEAYGERRSAFRPMDRFSGENLPAGQAASLKEFEPKKYIEPKNVRKYDFFSRLGIASAKLTFQSLPYAYSEGRKEDTGIVYACETQGMVTAQYLEDLVRLGPDLVSPKLFSVAAANSAACNISAETGIQGPSVNVSAKFASGFLTVFTGAQMIESGQVNDCLVGAIDYLSQVVTDAHARMGCYQKEGASGFQPGEGTISLMLTNQEQGAYGTILGIAYECSEAENYRWPSCDATHARVLQGALGENKADKFQSAGNGDHHIETLDRAAFEATFPAAESRPEVVQLKQCLGEFSAMPSFQVLAACCEPAGTKTLISVLSPGGVHGAMLVESSGRIPELMRQQKAGNAS